MLSGIVAGRVPALLEAGEETLTLKLIIGLLLLSLGENSGF